MNTSTSIFAGLFALTAAAIVVVLPNHPRSINHQLSSHYPRTPLATQRPNTAIQTIAHRGASKFAPENTLPAIRIAIDKGADYIELDVVNTLDGVPVLMHDESVDRTTNGTGDVSTLTLAELKQLDAGTWFAPEFAGTTVPTLEEALQLMQGKACFLWDTKIAPTPAMVALFRQYGFDRDCMLVSYGGSGSGGSDARIERLMELWPGAPIVPTVRDASEIDGYLAKHPALTGMRVLRQNVERSLVEAIHARGLRVLSNALYIGDREDMYRLMIDEGLDMVMLDNIDDFYATLASYDDQLY